MLNEPKPERKPAANANGPAIPRGHVPLHVQAFVEGRVGQETLIQEKVQQEVQQKVVMPHSAPFGEPSSAVRQVAVASQGKSPRETYAGEGLS
jgi:hypothetical protein